MPIGWGAGLLGRVTGRTGGRLRPIVGGVTDRRVLWMLLVVSVLVTLSSVSRAFEGRVVSVIACIGGAAMLVVVVVQLVRGRRSKAGPNATQ